MLRSYSQGFIALADAWGDTKSDIQRVDWREKVVRYLTVDFPPLIEASLGKREKDKFTSVIEDASDIRDVCAMLLAGASHLEATLIKRIAREQDRKTEQPQKENHSR